MWNIPVPLEAAAVTQLLFRDCSTPAGGVVKRVKPNGEAQLDVKKRLLQVGVVAGHFCCYTPEFLDGGFSNSITWGKQKSPLTLRSRPYKVFSDYIGLNQFCWTNGGEPEQLDLCEPGRPKERYQAVLIPGNRFQELVDQLKHVDQDGSLMWCRGDWWMLYSWYIAFCTFFWAFSIQCVQKFGFSSCSQAAVSGGSFLSGWPLATIWGDSQKLSARVSAFRESNWQLRANCLRGNGEIVGQCVG